MSLIEKQDYKITSTSDYTTALFAADTPDEQLQLFNTIRDKFKVEPALGEIMLVRGKPYFTSPGCSRIAETKHNKNIRFEYLDPTTYNVYLVREDPKRYIIVQCLLTKEDDGVVEGRRLLDLEDERHWQWGVCCWVNNPYKAGKKMPSKLYGPNEKHEKQCSICGKVLPGYDGWKLKDYCNFAETKAFMRAVGKAYNIELFEELPSELQKEAKDLVKIIKADVKPTVTKEEDLSDEEYDDLVNAPSVSPNAEKVEKEVKTQLIPPQPTPKNASFQDPFDVSNLLRKTESSIISFDEWLNSLQNCEIKGSPAKHIPLDPTCLQLADYFPKGKEDQPAKTFKIWHVKNPRTWVIVPKFKVYCPADWEEYPYINIPTELLQADRTKWEKILP